MKLASAAADGFLRKPDREAFGVLLHGPDAGLTALRRQELVRLLGEGDDMRITALDPAALTRDPAELDSAIKARGFFPGRRVVVIEGAKDALSKTLEPVLQDMTTEDAFLVITSTNLTAKSALRKLCEGHWAFRSIALYPNAITPTEIAEKLRTAGCQAELSRDCLEELAGMLAEADPGTTHQAIDIVSIYLIDRTDSVGFEEIRALLPPDRDTEIETLIDHVVSGRPGEIGPTMRRLRAGGTGAVQIMMFTSRRFHDLLSLALSPDGIDAALNRMRPPVFGPRRQRLSGHARLWGGRIEDACRMLFATERQLRSSGDRPDMALVERCLLRLSMMAAQRR